MEKRSTQITIIVIFVVGISLLHFFTDQTRYYYHVFYGELYFLPIVLAGFWFGLRGGLVVSGSITICFVPLVYWHWQGFSPDDFDRLMSVVLYNLLAMVIGILKDRDTVVHERHLQEERHAAMGKSLAAVAHDIKTPLIAIGGLSRQLQKKFNNNDPDRKKSAIIIQEAERLEKMLHSMLDFSRPLTLQLSNGDLNELVEDSISIIEDSTRKRGITVKCMLSHDLQTVLFDTIRMKQVIVNLVLNAVEASTEGGIVTLRTSDAHYGVTIDVADCGNGISLDHRKKVFNPFFTTKKEGTGLGLAIVKKIVEEHGGSLEIVDNSPKGVIFRVMLPAQGKK